MSEAEAIDLYNLIMIGHQSKFASMCMLANGEHVVRLREGDYFLWCQQDWFAWQERKAERGKQSQPHENSLTA